MNETRHYPGHEHDGPCGGQWVHDGTRSMGRTPPSPACSAYLSAVSMARYYAAKTAPGIYAPGEGIFPGSEVLDRATGRTGVLLAEHPGGTALVNFGNLVRDSPEWVPAEHLAVTEEISRD